MLTEKNIEEKILSVGSDNTDWFGGNFVGGYYLQQSPEELSKFIFYLLDKKDWSDCNYLEIGTAAGGLTRILYEYLNFKSVSIIDLGNHPNHIYFTENTKQIHNLYSFIGCSHSPEAKEFLDKLNLKYDLVFIDGDHKINAIIEDTDLSLKFLNDNGIISYHDTNFNEPKTAVNMIIERMRHKNLIKFEQNSKSMGITCLEF